MVSASPPVGPPVVTSPWMAQNAHFRKYSVHPVTFSRHILGHDMWGIPIHMMDSIFRRPRARVAVKGCHGSGKTFSAADLVIWWVLHDPEAMAITTAPTGQQVKRQMWAEIHKALGRATYRPDLPELFQTEFRLSDTNKAVGISTRNSTSFQGFHGKVLIVVDESPGVHGEVWQAIDGIAAAGDVRVLALGNPTSPAGPFFDMFQGRGRGVERITVDAFETPNLIGVTLDDLLEWERTNDPELFNDPLPYLVSRAWVLEMYWKHLARDPMAPDWWSRVRGQFPQQSVDALYPLHSLDHAKWTAGEDDGVSPVYAGIDPAGPGDDETTLVLRTGTHILGVWGWASADPRGNVRAILDMYRTRLARISVDATGSGWDNYLHWKDIYEDDGAHGQPKVCPVLPIIFGKAPITTKDDAIKGKVRFYNLKAQLYWAFRERLFDEGITGLVDEELYRQAAAARYENRVDGRLQIEDKDSYKKRVGRSPDQLEGCLLAFFEPPIKRGTGFSGQPENVQTRDMPYSTTGGPVKPPDADRIRSGVLVGNPRIPVTPPDAMQPGRGTRAPRGGVTPETPSISGLPGLRS